jgi:ParB-like nuclease domain
MTDVKDPFAAVGAPKMKSGRALLKKFKPYPNNPRIHPKAEIELLAQVLRMRGADQPIVVDEKWVILKGHGRLEAADLAGLSDFPYVQRIGLSESDKRAIRIEDNALPLLAGWDKVLISTELAQLKTDGYDMTLLGFGETQLVHFMTQPSAPAAFSAVDENIATEHRCPKCGFAWSGKPKS